MAWIALTLTATGVATAQQIDRPRRPPQFAAPAPAQPPTNLIVIQPQPGPPVFNPDYRLSSTSGYGAQGTGSAGYAGFYGYPGYGYSSRFGAPSYGYGGYAGTYGFPGYNTNGAFAPVSGYRRQLFGPGLFPNLRGTPGLRRAGFGGYAPLGWTR